MTPPSSLRPLALKAGISTGPCLAINQNDRLDYVGSTVNIGARLCSLCSGSDLVFSQAVREDAEVAQAAIPGAAHIPMSELLDRLAPEGRRHLDDRIGERRVPEVRLDAGKLPPDGQRLQALRQAARGFLGACRGASHKPGSR